MPFLANCWQVAACAAELVKPFVARRVAGQPLVIFRTVDGARAVDDICPHRLAPLSAGQRVGDELQCGYHGLRIAGDGRCTYIPGSTKIPSSAKVRSFPTIERWGVVWVWLGRPELADAALLPDLSWVDDPGWALVRGYIHIAADYRLLNDNLLDLSHESFVHPTSIGNGAGEEIALFAPTVTSSRSMVIVDRFMENIEVPPTFRALLCHDGVVDRIQRAIYMAPAIHISDGGLLPRDAEKRNGFRTRVIHLLTPETETSTHYFYLSCRNFAVDDDTVNEIMRRTAITVFAEDKAMLEAQQHVLTERKLSVPRIAWSIDEAPVAARRLLDALIEAEQIDATVVVPVEPSIAD